MAQATDYFKLAAANLKRAIQVKQDEINQLRHEISAKESECHQNVSKLHEIVRTHEREMITAPGSPAEQEIDRSAKLRSISQLHQQVTETRRDFDKRRDDINTAISNLEREIQDLRQQASDFEKRQ